MASVTVLFLILSVFPSQSDLRFLQTHGCAAECHSNGSVIFLQGTDEYAYDGQNSKFTLSMDWIPLVPVSSLEKKCLETLTSFIDLQREERLIKESRPEVYFSVKASGSSEQQVLLCLPSVFNRKHVQMEIRRDQTPLPDERLNSSEIRPNADESFQLKKSLQILPSQRSCYQCVVDEWILRKTDSDSLAEDTTVVPVGGLLGVVTLVSLIVASVIVLTIYQLIKYNKHPKKQKTLKTPSHVKLLRQEKRASLAPALNAASDDSLKEVLTEELHETQSLCEAEETPAAAPTAARGAIGSKNISLPDFAMEREDSDQKTVTQNTLLLPLQRHGRSQTISMPDLALERKNNSDSS
ncbi:uncharacterized protein LOC127979042 isoform X2 [Carassius gibelio]|uniref:uncharacterized protein LOC127979042 isoform X2 n=1 Tax=Carassius gibelio TaxID=101364 RepID=UPI002279E54C|nr:uncharacterized protein LOC127979042 isoform X2 [Carassius gibelio]